MIRHIRDCVHTLMSHDAPAFVGGAKSTNKYLREILDTNWINRIELHYVNGKSTICVANLTVILHLTKCSHRA